MPSSPLDRKPVQRYRYQASRPVTGWLIEANVKQVLFEFKRFGRRAVHIAAIDPETRLEVTMVGDITYGEEMLKRLAARKLNYVLNKKIREAEEKAEKTTFSAD